MTNERDAKVKHVTRVVEETVDAGYSPIEMRISWDVATKSAVLTVTFLQVPEDATLEEFQALAAAYWQTKGAQS